MTYQILVVDDEARIREVVKACLEDLAGWHAFTAASGQAGLEVAITELPDLILLDVSMPDMDGFQFFEQLQHHVCLRSIPIILLTAKVLAGDRNSFNHMHIAGVISKPFNPLTICHQIAELMGWA